MHRLEEQPEISRLYYQMTVAGQVVNVSADDYLKALDVDIRLNELKAKVAVTRRVNAAAFQLEGNTILNGLSEIRYALNVPQIDEEKEGVKESTVLKNVFNEEEKDVLKKKYIHFMQLFHKHISQLFPDHKSAQKNESGNNDSGDNAG
jgi:hypothetical protein